MNTTQQQKEHFLKEEYTTALTSLGADAPRKWGKMDVQQMIEHMSDYLRIANGKAAVQIVTPDEHIPAMHAFLASDTLFKENTPNKLMGDEPPAHRNESTAAAIAELQNELDQFFAVHNAVPDRKTANPFFGMLSYEQQIQLLYKHSRHHLRQFGVVE